MTSTNFVYGNIALPANKIDSGGGSAELASPTRQWSPNDANRVFAGLSGLRTAIGDLHANVLSFGATGDGVTDDTAAIQAALNAADGGLSTGISTALIPPGVYVISDTLFVPNFTVLTGIGRGNSARIKASGTFPTDGRPMVRLGRSTDTLAFGSRVERMIVDANSRAAKCVYSTVAQEQSGVRFVVASGFTLYGIHFETSSGIVVENSEVYPRSAGATSGIFLDGTAIDNVIKSVTVGVNGLLTNGLHVRSSQCIVLGFHMENCTNGINLDTNSSCVLIGVNAAGGPANVGTVILDSGENNHHIGIGLIRNNATTLISSPIASYTSTDDFMPLWVGGDSVLGGGLHIPFELAPVQITSNQNDYNPGGQFKFAQVVLLNSDAARDLTGIIAGNKGRTRWLFNSGAFNITLKHQNAGSAAANRFIGRGNADSILLPGTGVQIYYSPSLTRWLVLDNP